MIEDPDIQNFLAIFMDFQTQGHAKRLYSILVNKFLSMYLPCLPKTIKIPESLLFNKFLKLSLNAHSTPQFAKSSKKLKQNELSDFSEVSNEAYYSEKYKNFRVSAKIVEEEFNKSENFEKEELIDILTMLDPGKTGFVELNRYIIMM